MGRMLGNGIDVVQFLKEQHEQVKEMLRAVALAHGKDREKAFVALRRTLAVHEAAEEEIVHPAARRALPDGDVVVEARLREETEAKRALERLEALDPDSAEFEQGLRSLATDVIAHAEAEEREEFEQLGRKLDPLRLDRMRKAAQLAEAVAPTRPHPGLESRAANLLIGPFASMLDRARDAITTKR